ncbi:MAG: alpha/beta fold hydrolase [Planctomycetaceae bacterium]|nr:alpha/beta fold hydrolase [Planctomycetaceae bacterium]
MTVALLGSAASSAIGQDTPKRAAPADASAAPTVLMTAGGVRFGVWPKPPDKPSPTLFILGSTIDGTLGSAYFRQAGNALSERGYVCVSIDLPCHGQEQKEGEPEGIAGWRARAEKGEDFMKELTDRLTAVLDDLVKRGWTDPHRVAACGTSRGGFSAVHFAAAEPRVRCVAAYAPVTELTVVREFAGAGDNAVLKKLSLEQQAERLAGRAIWLIIGDRDDRVSTDHAIRFARAVTKESLVRKQPALVDLHVVVEPQGHTTPKGAAELSAAWIDEQLRQSVAQTKK